MTSSTRRTARFAAVTVAALAVLLGAAYAGANWFLHTPPGSTFIANYPGTTPVAAGQPGGYPAWLRITHLINFLLLLQLVRTGIELGKRQRPRIFVMARTRVTIWQWAHNLLDLLWILNGAAYLTLLFATGQWRRLVPTTLEVFPNAVSAGLQYAAWRTPAHDSWIHYNSLQQLTYFAVVFIIAPLAVLSGLHLTRWGQGLAAKRPALHRAFPEPSARRLHRATMLAMLAFVIVHVTLVLSTGAAVNLGHIFVGTKNGGWIGIAAAIATILAALALWHGLTDRRWGKLARKLGAETRETRDTLG